MEKREPRSLLVGIELPYNPTIPLLGMYLEKKKQKQNRNTNLKRYMQPNVHSNIIYNCQDMEAIYVSINRGMDKEDEVYIINGIVLSHKNNEVLTFSTTLDGLSIMLSEVSQQSLICGISKNITN